MTLMVRHISKILIPLFNGCANLSYSWDAFDLSWQCLKFKTDQAQDAKKMEKLNNIFFTMMARGPEGFSFLWNFYCLLSEGLDIPFHIIYYSIWNHECLQTIVQLHEI